MQSFLFVMPPILNLSMMYSIIGSRRAGSINSPPEYFASLINVMMGRIRYYHNSIMNALKDRISKYTKSVQRKVSKSKIVSYK